MSSGFLKVLEEIGADKQKNLDEIKSLRKQLAAVREAVAATDALVRRCLPDEAHHVIVLGYHSIRKALL